MQGTVTTPFAAGPKEQDGNALSDTRTALALACERESNAIKELNRVRHNYTALQLAYTRLSDRLAILQGETLDRGQVMADVQQRLATAAIALVECVRDGLERKLSLSRPDDWPQKQDCEEILLDCCEDAAHEDITLTARRLAAFITGFRIARQPWLRGAMDVWEQARREAETAWMVVEAREKKGRGK